MEQMTQIARRRLSSYFVCTLCLQRLHRLRNLAVPAERIRFSSRALHSSPRRFDNTTEQIQAVPLGDFYTDLLSEPIPKAAEAKPSIPTFVQSGDATKEARAAKLFGTIRGSGYERRTLEKPDATWRTINGVPIPPRPAEPDNCCMSGCVHCVWDDYRDDVESWAARLHEAQVKSQGREGEVHPKTAMQRSEVESASSSMDDDGGGSEGLWDSPSIGEDEGEKLFQGIPIGIREFMRTEKQIRERKQAMEKRNA